MSNIKVDIKKIVSENLQKTRKEVFDDAFRNAHKSINENEFIFNVAVASYDLIQEGYDISEIDSYILEQSLVDNMDDSLEKIKKADWGSIARSTILDSIKEYAIKWFLDSAGISEKWSRNLSITLSKFNPLDLLKPFKDSAGCSNYMPKLVDAIVLAFAREIAGEVTGAKETTVSSVLSGNLLYQGIESSNLGETLASKFCKVIHG
jgi:hypothetical protein